MDEQNAGGSSVGLLAAMGALMAKPFIAIGKAITADGTLAAAWRQGADEIGEALKPFPQSIQTQETGTILNPTQGEVAAARNPNASVRGAANDNRVYDPAQDHGQEQEHSRGR